jgi:hypothetical protein
MEISQTSPLRHLSHLPSAWLLLVQLVILVLAPLTNDSLTSHAISWCLSALALLLVATIIRNSPIFTAFGLGFVILGLGLSAGVAFGYDSKNMQVAAHLVEAVAYFYGAAGLVMYMFDSGADCTANVLWGYVHCLSCFKAGGIAIHRPLARGNA